MSDKTPAQSEVNNDGERLVRMESKIDGIADLINIRLVHIEENRERDRQDSSTGFRAVNEALEKKADAKELEPLREDIKDLKADRKKLGWLIAAMFLAAIGSVVFINSNKPTATQAQPASQVGKPF